jgi:hypothetical protein
MLRYKQKAVFAGHSLASSELSELVAYRREFIATQTELSSRAADLPGAS